MFVVTTAINYTNGPPHIGHVYEAILADFLVKYHSHVQKVDTFFLTGTDEHGQKIEAKANELGVTPIELCNRFSTDFINIDKLYGIDYSKFIRTTDIDHKKFVREFFLNTLDNNDIYLDVYHGWYNQREESFVTEFNAKQSDFKDSVTGAPLIEVKEQSYFFRLSKYVPEIKDILSNNDCIKIEPLSLKQSILERLGSDEIHDVSITRTNVKWGVPVPDHADWSIYVWFDALLNYISGIPPNIFPPTVQIIGKDISWFHCVIWLAMLRSGGYPLPKYIFAHGFVNDKDGNKMSKSVGNVVDPIDLLKTTFLSPDNIRYSLLKNSNSGHDINLDVVQMISDNNSELLAKVGNCVARVYKLVTKFNIHINITDVTDVTDDGSELVANFQFGRYVRELMDKFDSINFYINETQPWKQDVDAKSKTKFINKMVNDLVTLNTLLYPVCPNISLQITEILNKLINNTASDNDPVPLLFKKL